jgi:hypothetical protein
MRYFSLFQLPTDSASDEPIRSVPCENEHWPHCRVANCTFYPITVTRRISMSTSKIHPSLPAPVVHAGFTTVSQSKSHLLAGVQDAYWSDDEGVSVHDPCTNAYCSDGAGFWFQEDAECPLCLEEMDISDLNFKPCICGYQACPRLAHFLPSPQTFLL